MTKRWSETQHLVAGWFAARGWPYAEAVGNGRGGVDVTGTPDLAVEVKAEDGWRPTTWLRQARDNRPDNISCGTASGLPADFVVQRPKGYGPERIDSWPVIIRLDTFTALLREAGYGETAS